MSGALSVAGSGLMASTEWLAMAGGNIANANDTSATPTAAYRTQSPVLAPVPAGAGQGAGVTVTGVAAGPATGRPVFEPGAPNANAQGVTFYPTDSLASQLTQVDMAGLSAQANVVVMRRAVAAYQSLLATAPSSGQGG